MTFYAMPGETNRTPDINLSPSLLSSLACLLQESSKNREKFPYDTVQHQLFLAAGKVGTLGKVLQQMHSKTQERRVHHQEGLVYVREQQNKPSSTLGSI